MKTEVLLGIVEDLRKQVARLPLAVPGQPQGVFDTIGYIREGIKASSKDADRYQTLRDGVSATQMPRWEGGLQRFVFPKVEPVGDIMKGSVAQHLDAALDMKKARAATEQPTQNLQDLQRAITCITQQDPGMAMKVLQAMQVRMQQDHLGMNS